MSERRSHRHTHCHILPYRRQRNFINERASFQLRKCHKCPSSNIGLKHAKFYYMCEGIVSFWGDLRQRTFISPSARVVPAPRSNTRINGLFFGAFLVINANCHTLELKIMSTAFDSPSNSLGLSLAGRFLFLISN